MIAPRPRRPAAALCAALLLPLLAAAARAQAPQSEPAPPPGFLGVSMGPLEVEGGTALIQVTAVVPGSPAARAGIQPGDVILALDGTSVSAPRDDVVTRFAARIRAHGVGAEVSLLVRRRAVSVRTYVDEEPTGPAADGEGRRWGDALPDLSELAEENDGRLVTVRARAFAQERDVRVQLGARPGVTDRPLPPNATLRPDLEAAPLAAEAAFAARVIGLASVTSASGDLPLQASYDAVLERLEADERVEDPFRLRTVRYLHRAPLRLPGATRALARDLGAVLGSGSGGDHGVELGVAGLVAVARRNLDAVASIASTLLPSRPAPGASPDAHAAYLVATLTAARERVDMALGDLSQEERELLARELPSLADRFAVHLYLHEDEDPERWERHARALALLPRVDREVLLQGLEALAPLAGPEYLGQLRADLRAAEAQGATAGGAPATSGSLLHYAEHDWGYVVFGGSGPNEHRLERAVVVDLGGDDRYHAAAAARPDFPASVVLDLGGNDRYQATASFAQGAALLGVALLVDLEGDDVYTSSATFAQGAALCGAALLLDCAGDDVYRARTYAQGAALCQGLGALVDGGGQDVHLAGLYAQGFAGPGAAGLLLARGGDDRYAALGAEPCTYGDAGVFHAMSQGAAVGFRGYASGGVAVLLDDGGDDVYEAGNFSQGGGYYFGWGSLVDRGGGADRYEGSRYAQGFAAHSALGSLLDEGGDDRYRGWIGAGQAAAWDLSVTVFLDDAGDDRSEPGPGFSLGASAHNGLALFCDRSGDDTYTLAPARAGPNDYHGGPSVSVFVDAGGGDDTYVDEGRNGAAAAHAEHGVAVDLPWALEDASEDLLRDLLSPPGREQRE